MSSNEQILQQIDALVASKTFSLDAVDTIKAIKDKLKITLNERDAVQAKYDDLLIKNSNAQNEIERQKSVIDALRTDLTAARALNDAGQKAIYEADKHKAVAEAWQGAMAMVFKPNAVRETVARSVPVAVPMNSNGYMGSVQMHPEGGSVTREDA